MDSFVDIDKLSFGEKFVHKYPIMFTEDKAFWARELDKAHGSGFSFDDLQAWGSNSGDTSICYNCPEKGDVSVYLKHKPSGKTGYVKLPNYQ